MPLHHKHPEDLGSSNMAPTWKCRFNNFSDLTVIGGDGNNGSLTIREEGNPAGVF